MDDNFCQINECQAMSIYFRNNFNNFFLSDRICARIFRTPSQFTGPTYVTSARRYSRPRAHCYVIVQSIQACGGSPAASVSGRSTARTSARLTSRNTSKWLRMTVRPIVRKLRISYNWFISTLLFLIHLKYHL